MMNLNKPSFFLIFSILIFTTNSLYSAESVFFMRADNLVVTPSTQPVTQVLVANNSAKDFNGSLSVKFPEGWKVDQVSKELSIKAGESQKIPFAIMSATDIEANSYALSLHLKGGEVEIRKDTSIVCSTAPYAKPKIDGQLDDWKDALPIRFKTGEYGNVVYTYWNRRAFCLALEVNEKKHLNHNTASPDAIQFALSPEGAQTGKKGNEKSQRYEFLVIPQNQGEAKVLQLLDFNNELSLCQEAMDVGGEHLAKSYAKCQHKNGKTIYEISIPLKIMPELRATTGRAFCFSFLIHDPDGTGIRNFGEQMRLPENQKSDFAWRKWQGAKWRQQTEFDNKLEWGFSSSIH
ncbi:MAG: hypothetical protein HQL32_10345 [Planctomycetes bacterium]|nr:hypothetical protein [Planctomycetota bacterium]